MPTTRQQTKKLASTSTSHSTDAPGPSTFNDIPFDTDNSDEATTPPQSEAGGVNPTVNDSPVAYKIAGSGVFTSTHIVRDIRMEKLGLEMEGKLLGPMPVDLFLAEFLPSTGTTAVSEVQQTLLEEASNKRGEIPMYEPLIAAISPACTGLVIVDTHGTIDPATNLKPDFAAYKTKPSRTTDFSEIEVHVEVKHFDSEDPFQDDELPFERAAQGGRDTLGQIASYATAQFTTQFRTHLFSVLIFHKDARLIRWDRSGAIVTRRFNYCETIHLLDFFRRYNDLLPEQRGEDTSVTAASGRGIFAARKALGVDSKTPLLRFSIRDSDTATDHFYIAKKPEWDGSTSPTGRHTRGFHAYDLTAKKTVFLKDTWRIDLPRLQREGDIYKALTAANVPHMASCKLAADIEGQHTRTSDFADAPWLQGRGPILRPHQHYRIVLDLIGRPLTTFRSSKELVTALRDALEAHKQAFEKVRILHRDISAGNILITEDGRGLLIDWDLSKPCDELGTEARQHERTGTWQFMSAMLLSRNVTHTLADDLESFLHVLTWVALRYMPHQLATEDLTKSLADVFDSAYKRQGSIAGGDVKQLYVRSSGMLDAKFKNPHIVKLLENLGAFSYRYLEYASVRTIITQDVFEALRRENLAKLDDHNWMLNTFQVALDSPGWPERDRSSQNPLEKKGGDQLKQKSSKTVAESERPTKKQKTS